jgi:thiamine-phosphate pyrophosphorylase
MMKKSIDYSIYLVTDDYYLNIDGSYQVIELAMQAGVTLLQYRAKEKTGRDMLREAIVLRELSKKYKVPLIINDRMDIALAVEAEGLHLGQDDLPLSVARKYMGDKIIGVSATTYDEACSAIRQGADYVGAGPVFPTSTKKDAKPACGLADIQRIKQEFPAIPLVAIGGINPNNLSQVIQAGGNGAAVISCVFSSDNPAGVVRQFARLFASMKRGESKL